MGLQVSLEPKIRNRDFYYGQLVGVWKSHDKVQAKSLDDRGSVGYLLDIDIWQSGTTRIMQDGVVIKGLAPRRLDPCRYELTAGPTLDDLEKNIASKQVFVASMMHSSSHPLVLMDTPDVTCPSDTPIDKKRKEVVTLL